MGTRVVAHELAARCWSARHEFELACELNRRGASPTGRMDVEMRHALPTFAGFRDELELVGGTDYGQALRRELTLRAGVPGLFVAESPDGRAVYAQWLLTREARDRLASLHRGPWRALEADEAMVEYAYTFTSFRGLGVMAAGMAQLLDAASAAGARRVYTYVRTDNVPSLRGCAKVGFVPVGLAVTLWRAGVRRTNVRPLGELDRRTWAAATAARS